MTLFVSRFSHTKDTEKTVIIDFEKLIVKRGQKVSKLL